MALNPPRRKIQEQYNGTHHRKYCTGNEFEVPHEPRHQSPVRKRSSPLVLLPGPLQKTGPPIPPPHPSIRPPPPTTYNLPPRSYHRHPKRPNVHLPAQSTDWVMGLGSWPLVQAARNC
uniref:Uncharacterized protein n=1 Tax=Cacopsylla melanoneura TaxID=428564 RepID=A0A8D8QQ66_9HEMI